MHGRLQCRARTLTTTQETREIAKWQSFKFRLGTDGYSPDSASDSCAFWKFFYFFLNNQYFKAFLLHVVVHVIICCTCLLIKYISLYLLFIPFKFFMTGKSWKRCLLQTNNRRNWKTFSSIRMVWNKCLNTLGIFYYSIICFNCHIWVSFQGILNDYVLLEF